MTTNYRSRSARPPRASSYPFKLRRGAAFDTVELRWPQGWPRTEKREQSPYRVTLTVAVRDLRHELHLMGATDVLVTSGPVTEVKGADPGVAAYWRDASGIQRTVACDTWTTQAGNARAIGLTIEALRAIGRTKVTQLAARAAEGFRQLSAGDSISKDSNARVLS